MSKYIKKEDALSKILIEFTDRESNGKVMCACADVKQTCADILDGLTTYSFPDSSDIEKIRAEIEDIDPITIMGAEIKQEILGIIDKHIGGKDGNNV